VIVIEHNLDVIKTADWPSIWGRMAACAEERSWRKDAGRHCARAGLLYRAVPAEVLELPAQNAAARPG